MNAEAWGYLLGFIVLIAIVCFDPSVNISDMPSPPEDDE